MGKKVTILLFRNYFDTYIGSLWRRNKIYCAQLIDWLIDDDNDDDDDDGDDDDDVELLCISAFKIVWQDI